MFIENIIFHQIYLSVYCCRSRVPGSTCPAFCAPLELALCHSCNNFRLCDRYFWVKPLREWVKPLLISGFTHTLIYLFVLLSVQRENPYYISPIITEKKGYAKRFSTEKINPPVRLTLSRHRGRQDGLGGATGTTLPHRNITILQ